MKTRAINSNGMVEVAESRHSLIKKFLLYCGVVSSLLYVAINILGAIQWEGYSSVSQTFSELIAIDAPSRSLAVPLSVIYCFLIYAFGLGVWKSAGQKRALRIAAILIVGKEVLGLAATLFAPIHLRGIEGTQSDIMHGILTFVGVLICMFPAMGFGASVFGKKFRLYTVGTMLIFLVCGILAGLYQPAYVSNLPTPWMGVWERINIFGYMLWIVVFAISLLRNQTSSPKNESIEKIVQKASMVDSKSLL